MARRFVSVQHVMGCAADSRSGCGGGWAHHAYDALQDSLSVCISSRQGPKGQNLSMLSARLRTHASQSARSFHREA
eukprot:6143603-Amphidinium_carterae.1